MPLDQFPIYIFPLFKNSSPRFSSFRNFSSSLSSTNHFFFFFFGNRIEIESTKGSCYTLEKRRDTKDPDGKLEMNGASMTRNKRNINIRRGLYRVVRGVDEEQRGSRDRDKRGRPVHGTLACIQLSRDRSLRSFGFCLIRSE